MLQTFSFVINKYHISPIAPSLISSFVQQGLCGFYEKSGKEEYQKDLAEVYEKLLEFFDK